MILYHFTSARHLPAIARYGLTVGDVPTDIERNRGKCGVWLTSDLSPDGHGLEGSGYFKKRYRLTVDVDGASPSLVKWSDWAPANATPITIESLESTAGQRSVSWWISFRVIPIEWILECVDMQSGAGVENWRSLHAEDAVKPVPPWRRASWHRALLKRIRRVIQER